MKRQIFYLVLVAGLLCAFLRTAVTASGATDADDTSPPHVLSLSYEPYWADTSDAAQTITVTAHITDDLSGVKHLWSHYSAERATLQQVLILMTETHRISGTALDGIYQTTFTLPQYSAYGRWVATDTCTRDYLDNQNCVSYFPPYEDRYSPTMRVSPWFWNGYTGTYLPLIESHH